MNETIEIATESNVQIVAPFIDIEKDQIARIGHELNVDWLQTWSCYEGANTHCGRCGTCVERAEAFYLAAIPDPTLYQDPDFWKEATGVS
jgi:7-cyano-7-deazaguanine synthase